MPIVDLPDGREIEFPEGTSKDVMSNAVQNFLAKNPAPEKIGKYEAAGRAGLQGLSFGFGDEIIGGAKNLGNKAARGIEKAIYGDNIIPETSYYKERDIARDKLEQAREQHPALTTTTEIASSLIPGAALLKAGGKAFTGAKTFSGKVAQNVGAGFVDSALYGAGEAGEISDIPQSMLESGVKGAAISAAFQPLAAGAGAIYKTGKRLIKGKNADDILGSVIDPKDARQMANRLERADGRETLPIDLQNKEVSGLIKLLGKQKGSEKIIEQIVSRRASTSPLRVSNLLNKISSNERYFGTLDELDAGRKAAAQPLIQKAYGEGAEIPRLFNEGRAVDETSILSGKAAGKPLSPQQRVLASEYETLASDPRFQNYASEFGNVKPNSVEMLHNIRKSVDAERATLERNIAGPSPNSAAKSELRSLNNFRKKLSNVMYKATGSAEGKVGAMEEADKIYSDSFSLERAQELGKDFSKIKSDAELRQITKDLTPDQWDAFRIGIRQDLYEKALSTSDRSANAAERIFGNPLYRKKLAVAFPDKKQYLDFAKRMIDEIRIVRTKQELLGGIRINPEQLNEGQVINNAINFATSPNKTVSVIKAVKDSIQKKYLGINDKNAKALAEILTSRQKSIEALKRVAQNAEAKERPIINSFINDNIRAIIAAQIASGSIDKELTKSDPSKRSSFSIVSDANAQEPSKEELMNLYYGEKMKYPGIYANKTPQEQEKMLARGGGKTSEILPNNLSREEIDRLAALQEEERRKYPSLYINKPRLTKQNYGGN